MHTAKCKLYTERIALASSSRELHQIVNTLSNRHPPKILPTIYPSAHLPSIFIKQFTNKVQKLRASVASEHDASTLVTGTTAATFSSLEKVSQLKVKECILNSAPKSCELDPIPSKLLLECLDSILPSFTDLFNSSLASGIFLQCFKSALVTPILNTDCRSRFVENFQKSREEGKDFVNAVRYASNALPFKWRRSSYLWYDNPELDYARRQVQSCTDKYGVSSRQYADAITNLEALHASAAAKAASEIIDEIGLHTE